MLTALEIGRRGEDISTYCDGLITLGSTVDLSDSDLKGAVVGSRAASGGGGLRGNGRGNALRDGETSHADDGGEDGGGRLHRDGRWMKGSMDGWLVGG